MENRVKLLLIQHPIYLMIVYKRNAINCDSKEMYWHQISGFSNNPFSQTGFSFKKSIIGGFYQRQRIFWGFLQIPLR